MICFKFDQFYLCTWLCSVPYQGLALHVFFLFFLYCIPPYLIFLLWWNKSYLHLSPLLFSKKKPLFKLYQIFETASFLKFGWSYHLSFSIFKSVFYNDHLSRKKINHQTITFSEILSLLFLSFRTSLKNQICFRRSGILFILSILFAVLA